MRKILALLILLILGAGTYFLYLIPKVEYYSPPQSQIPEDQIYKEISYEAVDKSKYSVSLVSDKLLSPTRIKLTPNGKHLLVSQITGELLSFDKTKNGWNDKGYLVAKVETSFPGFPPDEAGLTGIVLSSDFNEEGKIFLLHTSKDSADATQNRVSVTNITERGGKLFGTQPEMIYQANIVGASSHQITDGVSLKINNEPHIMFTIGEGLIGKRAQNINEEGGKVILIKEDGSNPDGIRPYSENPRIEAIGIRNAYVITKNPFDPLDRYIIADTGPDKFDRLLYTKLGHGENQKPINFGWDGSQDSLADPIPDPNTINVLDMAIFRLPETRTFAGLVFLNEPGQFLATIFGRTGSFENSPGKEIWLGSITNLTEQPKVSFSPIIKRAEEANGKLGNPIGLEINPINQDFFFADILEGRLYKVKRR